MAQPVLGTGKFRAFTASGAPLVGGKLNTYVSGTTTPQATYPTQADAVAGTNANANPVILDSAGEANVWVNALTYKFVLTDSNNVTLETVDNYGPGTAYSSSVLSEWTPALTAIGAAPTFGFISSTSFTINAGSDLSTILHAGRRVKTTNTAGTIYSTVLSIAYSAPNNTLVVVNDAGVIDSGISALSYGITSYANPSYLDPRTAFCVTKSGNMTGFATATQVTGWNVAIDKLTEWDNANNRWSSKFAGNYLVTAQIEISDTGTNVVQTIGIGGFNIIGYSSPTANAHCTLTWSRVLPLSAIVILQVALTGSANTTVYGTNSTFSIARIP